MTLEGRVFFFVFGFFDFGVLEDCSGADSFAMVADNLFALRETSIAREIRRDW
jgi:hypothetical protein